MKRTLIIAVSVLLVVTLVLGASIAMAAKPQDAGNKGMDVIEKSNGFPSGEHFNLNIHGKDGSTYTCPDEDDEFTVWGKSVFISENTDDTKIYYHSNKKGNIDDLKVIDGCGVFDGSVTVQLPAPPQDLPPELQGYHVFARILAKPNNSKKTEGNPSFIMLSPNTVDTLCNDPYQDPITGEWSCPDELSLGLVLIGGVYVDNGTEFERFQNPKGEKRGKSKAVDITALFTYEGWVVDDSLDIWDAVAVAPGQDGLITVGDIPVSNWDCDDGTTAENRDINGDTLVNPDLSVNFTDPETKVLDPDLLMYLQYKAMLPLSPAPPSPAPACWDPVTEPQAWDFTDGMWILNIADYVLTWQDITNDGTKLLQVRFYPRWTTEYIPPPAP